MIAPPHDVEDTAPDANDRARPEPTSPRRGVRARLRTAKSAVEDLHAESLRLLRLRRSRIVQWLKRMAWTAVGAVMLAGVGAVALSAAIVMTLLGTADMLATWLGTPAAAGRAMVGAFVVLTFLLAVGYGKSGGSRRAQQAAAEADNQRRLRHAGVRLFRALGTVPSLLITGAASAIGLALVRDRRLRRAALMTMGLARAAERISRLNRATSDGAAAAPVAEART